ncbi:hypothetical protein HS088_TW23G00888 [Tripterygium wilfordii]|uniref:Methyltransferase type 12 domain-containing protein n=1 Tax=Tripterygium wilfordii TaxID=458696 RepID=A0A7J7BX01_TRIWF|nr:uncharacterized protein LOC119993786 [Tripterygium wilfordii]KAF5726147.1 hypothetical protein HS088_TW23G00888 [Tripterygium wilfordii]
MASDARDSADQHPQPQKIQIYPTLTAGVSPFWRDKYERDAMKYWDRFYRQHEDRFFKDRHYLDKEWGQYFSGAQGKVLLEVGCGAGNAIFPLIATYPDIFVHACDFSPRAVDLVKIHKDYTDNRVNAFVCDLTIDDLSRHISPSSIDVVTMIFVLSAVSPEKMFLALRNIKKVLKPNGYVLFRDYATGDLAQERFSCKDQKISENFYVRGDGTRAFYFSNDFLTSLFKENGFDVKEFGLCCKQVENRARELVMNRRWLQAVFQFSDGLNSFSSTEGEVMVGVIGQHIKKSEVKENNLKDSTNNNEVDMSEGVGAEMFGISPSNNEMQIIEVNLKGLNLKIEVLSKEHQHTCKSTGLMLWESARLMTSILAENPVTVAGKKVLELGCGCGGICSMAAVKSANLMVATDGDTKALELLSQNINSNLRAPLLSRLYTKVLDWGNKEHIEAIKEINSEGFDVIIGTDVTYVPEAISPLFATAKELLSTNRSNVDLHPALVLCHVWRRVDEPSLLSAASQFGFRLVDKWPARLTDQSGSSSIASPWFPEDLSTESIGNTALSIMYFHRE